jgi:hypothetical protein
LVWLAAAAVAVPMGILAIARESHRVGVPLSGPAARRFAFALAPPLAAGAVLTAALWRSGAQRAIPGAWLLLYGAAVAAAGGSSIPSIPVLGAGFMLLGTAALFAPSAWGNAFLAAGFGGLQIAFGLWIA